MHNLVHRGNEIIIWNMMGRCRELRAHLLRLLRREAVEGEPHRLLQVPRQQLILLLKERRIVLRPALPSFSSAPARDPRALPL